MREQGSRLTSSAGAASDGCKKKRTRSGDSGRVPASVASLGGLERVPRRRYLLGVCPRVVARSDAEP